MKMYPHQLLALKALLKDTIAAVDEIPVQKSCLTCVNYSPPHCQLAGVAPPAEVIQDGCESWVFDTNSPPF